MKASKRIARRLQAHFGITYSTALRCFRDTVADPGFDKALLTIQFRVAGCRGGDRLRYDDAVYAICLDWWEFEDGGKAARKGAS